jgi:hypothetical protein
MGTYEDQFPPHLGPPRIPNGKGTKTLSATKPSVVVTLDAGAFRAVWELLEGEAKHRFPAADAITGYAAYLRAVDSFRESYWAQNEAPPAPAASGRRLSRPKR